MFFSQVSSRTDTADKPVLAKGYPGTKCLDRLLTAHAFSWETNRKPRRLPQAVQSSHGGPEHPRPAQPGRADLAARLCRAGSEAASRHRSWLPARPGQERQPFISEADFHDLDSVTWRYSV